MARGFGATYGVGASDTIALSTPPFSDTRSWWLHFFPHAIAGADRHLVMGRNSGASTWCPAIFLCDNLSDSVSILHGFSGSQGLWYATTPSLDNWHRLGVSLNTSPLTAPVVYLDGVKPTVNEYNSPNGTAYQPDSYAIGNTQFDGMAAEYAMWNCILTDAEFAALDKGISPALIRPQSLVEYVPMVRDTTSRKLAPSNPNDQYVKMLLHCDGLDGSTNFSDSTGKHSIVSAIEIDTAWSKFGGSSAYNSSAQSWYRLNPKDNFDDFIFGTGPFTIDCVVRLAAGSTRAGIYSGGSQGANNLNIYVWDSRIYVVFNNANRIISDLISDQTDYHVALTRSGNDFRVFLNGAQSGSTYTGSDDLGNDTANGYPWVAHRAEANHAFWMDEFRLLKGYAAWTSGFTPSVAPYSYMGASGTLVQPHPRIIMPRPRERWLDGQRA